MPKIPEHSKLDSLIEWANNYREDQLFIGLSCLKRSTIEIVREQLSKVNSDLNAYIIQLECYSHDFAEDYATNDNDCFKNDKERFKKFRASYKFLNDFILRCCPASPRLAYDYSGRHITYSDEGHSFFCNNTATQLDLFGRQSYPVDIQSLCCEFEKFFNLIEKGDEICKRVIQTEDCIRKNPLWCELLYNDAYNEESENCMDSINSLKNCKNLDLADKFEEARKSGVPEDKLYVFLYHMLTKREFHNHVVSNELRIARLIGLQNEEEILYRGKPLEYILSRRYLIYDFDKVAYVSRGDTLASECIAFLIEWNAVEEGKAKLFYDYFVKNYQGKYQIPTYQAVNKALANKLGAGNKEGRTIYNEFAEKLNNQIAQTTTISKRKLPQMLSLRTEMYAQS